MTRRYDFAHVYNMRDLGGYPTAGGTRTAFGRLIRSDVPAVLSDSEITCLRDIGITMVFDLRAAYESKEEPSALAGAQGFRCHSFPLGIGGRIPDSEGDIGSSYMRVAGSHEMMRSLMQTAGNHGGVLFHCSFGKDRTGVVAALLLQLAEVPMGDILADYQVSHTYLRGKVQRLFQQRPELEPWVGQSKPEYLESFFALFAARYGSLADYLEEIGLSAQEVLRLRNKLRTCDDHQRQEGRA